MNEVAVSNVQQATRCKFHTADSTSVRCRFNNGYARFGTRPGWRSELNSGGHFGRFGQGSLINRTTKEGLTHVQRES